MLFVFFVFCFNSPSLSPRINKKTKKVIFHNYFDVFPPGENIQNNYENSFFCFFYLSRRRHPLQMQIALTNNRISHLSFHGRKSEHYIYIYIYIYIGPLKLGLVKTPNKKNRLFVCVSYFFLCCFLIIFFLMIDDTHALIIPSHLKFI